jgi:hypothetical protein
MGNIHRNLRYLLLLYVNCITPVLLCRHCSAAAAAAQAEIAELSGLVESLTRKNRHLADELAESSRAQEAGHSQLMSLQVGMAHCMHEGCF